MAKGVKATREKKMQKYVSKFVGEIITPIIKEKLKTVKRNPKTLEKWAEKLKLDIQRNVSLASKKAFCEFDKNALLSEIQREEAAIASKCMSIKATLLSNIKQTKVWIPETSLPEDGSSTGRFDSKVNGLNSQLRSVADQLVGTLKDLESKVNSLDSTVTVIDNWKTSQRENAQQPHAQPAFGIPSPIARLGESQTSLAMQSVIEHLS